MKRDLPSSGRGGKGGHGKGGDGPRPAYMARSENDNETDFNKKNANKRINLKVRFPHPYPHPLFSGLLESRFVLHVLYGAIEKPCIRMFIKSTQSLAMSLIHKHPSQSM